MYCVKCKAKTEGKEEIEITMKNGRKAMKSKCAVCGTVGFRILGKPKMPPPTSPPLG